MLFLAPSELYKSLQVFSSFFSALLLLAAFSACSGSFQPSLDWSRLVQTNLDYSSQIQSNLAKSSQIQKNLLQAISGSIQCMLRIFIVYSSLDQTSEDQFSLLQSKLVKSSQIQTQTNLVKSSKIQKIFSRLFLAAYSTCGGSLQSSLV